MGAAETKIVKALTTYQRTTRPKPITLAKVPACWNIGITAKDKPPVKR